MHIPNRRRNKPALKRRQDGAAKRADARAKLSAEGQLKRLDRMLGKGKGAKQERERLTQKLTEKEQLSVK